MVFEHLVADGWSGTVLLRDLRTFYADEVGAFAEPLPDVVQDFPEFAERQRVYLESAAGLRIRRTLVRDSSSGPIPDTPILGFTGYTPVRHDHNHRIDRTLDEHVYARLEILARSTRTTRFNIVLAALHAALSDLSGQKSTATTMTVANRGHPSLRNSVGWFSSKVVVGSSPGTAEDPVEHLLSIRSEIAKSLEASRVPWATQIHDRDPELFGRPAPTPFLSFNAQPARMQQDDSGVLFVGADVKPIAIRIGWQDAALATTWQEDPQGGLRMTVNYRTDWYSEADVDGLWQAVTTHLERLAAVALRH